MQTKQYLKFLASAVAGGLLAFAYAPYGGDYLAFIAPAVLFYIWHSCTPRQAFYSGYLFGLSLFAIGISWVHISINLFGGVGVVGSYAITLLLVAFLGLYPALVGLLSRLPGNAPGRVHYLLVLPALWTLIEWCRGRLFTGFPWLNLGASQTDTLLSAYAPVLGVYGISFMVCVTAGGIVLLCLQRRSLPAAIVLIAIFAGALSLGKISWTRQHDPALSAVLVQGAIPQAMKWRPEIREKTYQLYWELTEPYRDSDLIVWPETAVPAFIETAGELLEHINRSLNPSETVFLTGILSTDQAGQRYHNSILLMDDQYYLYHKRHLVPFGEYIPLHSLLAPILEALHIPVSDFSAGGPGPAGFKTSKGLLGLSICYENAFGDEIRRPLPAAEILVNVSNDAWFGDSIAIHQHLQIARMRSMETERFMLRSTNTGISAIIDHKGGIIAQSPPFEPHALTAEVHRRGGGTPFTMLGYWPVLVLCLCILGVHYLRLRKANLSPTT